MPGQDEYESLETFFANVDLGFAENAAHRRFHTIGPSRPPGKPLGLFRAFIASLHAYEGDFTLANIMRKRLYGEVKPRMLLEHSTKIVRCPH